VKNPRYLGDISRSCYLRYRIGGLALAFLSRWIELAAKPLQAIDLKQNLKVYTIEQTTR
jgi:hypothetical protein